MLLLAAFPMHYYPAAQYNPILPFNSKRSRLPNPAVRGGTAAPVGATGSKVRIGRNSEVIGPLSRNEMAICHSLMPQFSVTGYSVRKASTGFTDAARRAGRKLATADARPSKTATHPKSFRPTPVLRIAACGSTSTFPPNRPVQLPTRLQ
jgi:hypothetical protein